jgi:hypothetical protein
MGLSFLKTFISSTIGSFIGNLLLKVFMWSAILFVAHGLLIFAVDNVNGENTSFGTALGQAVKGDVNFIMDNSANIIEGASENIEDFNKVLGQ